MKLRSLSHVMLGLSLAACGFANAAPPPADAPAAPAAAPATQPASDTQRTVPTILKDFQTQAQSLQRFLTPKTIGDKAKREAEAPNAIATLRKMQGYLDELQQTNTAQGKQIASQIRPQLETFLAIFGDQPSADALDKRAAGTDKDDALAAKGSLLMVRWIKASPDAAEQEKIFADAKALADANPDSAQLIGAIAAMSRMAPANDELSQKTMQLAKDQQGRIQEGHQKRLAALENKPLTIKGVRFDGSTFSTADWKGKVVFVDFWATWCGPCRAELPRVKKAYADFHDKGLEVLGVSCDNDASELSSFLAQNKDMPWPQLFDAKHPGWSPIATGYGIDAIPTMFLIDKKGILRSVTARENFETMIPKLLDEKLE